MTTKKLTLLMLVVLFVSTLSGCDDQKLVLPKVREYFPQAVLFKFDKRVLWIGTGVDGISFKTAVEIFEEFCQNAETVGKLHLPLAAELAADGHNFLVISFRQGVVAWDVRDGIDPRNRIPRFQILNWNQVPDWFTQHLGYYPRKDQIVIVGQ